VEIDQRNLPPPGFPDTDVVAMLRVRPTIAVVKQAVATHLIVVRWLLALNGRRRGDRQRQPEDGRSEDALRPHERDSTSVVLEASGQDLPRKRVGMQPCLLLEETEGLKTHAAVDIRRRVFYHLCRLQPIFGMFQGSRWRV